jgi:hypothetical protein
MIFVWTDLNEDKYCYYKKRFKTKKSLEPFLKIITDIFT